MLLNGFMGTTLMPQPSFDSCGLLIKKFVTVEVHLRLSYCFFVVKGITNTYKEIIQHLCICPAIHTFLMCQHKASEGGLTKEYSLYACKRAGNCGPPLRGLVYVLVIHEGTYLQGVQYLYSSAST